GPGTSCGANMVCNSQGMCIMCTSGASCTTNPNVCRNGMTDCSSGAQACVDGGNKPNGTGCNDGQACTYNDVCTNGGCGGTSRPRPPTMCQASSACDGSGGCLVVNKPDTTPCDDNQPCTFSDSCKNGACIGQSYTCTPGQCQSGAACNGTGGCLYSNKQDG